MVWLLKKIHEVISFKQNKWLEKYISFNTQKPNKAKNDFEKNFFKFLLNAAFGNFWEDVRNRLKIEIMKKKILRNLLNNNRN